MNWQPFLFYPIYVGSKLFKKLIFCGLFVFTTSVSSSTNQSQSPEEAAISFYHDYLTSSQLNVTESLKQSDIAIAKYTTRHLQKEINMDNSGSDYFTHAQEFCPEWATNIAVSNTKTKSDTSHIILTLGFEKSLSSYDVGLIKEQKIWKLNSVKFISRQSGYCN